MKKIVIGLLSVAALVIAFVASLAIGFTTRTPLKRVDHACDVVAVGEVMEKGSVVGRMTLVCLKGRTSQVRLSDAHNFRVGNGMARCDVTTSIDGVWGLERRKGPLVENCRPT